jgi:hypothetical protein
MEGGGGSLEDEICPDGIEGWTIRNQPISDGGDCQMDTSTKRRKEAPGSVSR